MGENTFNMSPPFPSERLGHPAYPYWGAPDAVNRTYPAAVTRIDERKESKGIALKFLVNLDSPSTAPATIFYQV